MTNFMKVLKLQSLNSNNNKITFKGTCSVLKYKPGDSLCPRLIFNTYFTIMNFKSSEDILNCRLTRNGKEARPHTKLSYCQSLKDSKTIMKLRRDLELQTSARKVSRLPVSRPCWIRRPLFRMYKCTEVGAQNQLHSTTTTVASTEEWILVLSYCSNFILFFSHSRKYN